MPGFRESATTAAAPEEVWKVLYDPARFPEWWTGIGSVEAEPAGAGEAERTPFTMYPDGYPDFPMPQILESSREDRTVSVSCLVSDLRFEWRLEATGAGTRIRVEVEIPEAEAHRLAGQQQAIASAVRRLAEVAETA
jgi:uncharacterized protein YndB with AHSA1/START domain